MEFGQLNLHWNGFFPTGRIAVWKSTAELRSNSQSLSAGNVQMRTITCMQKSYAEAIVCWSVWLRVTFVRNAQQKFMSVTESFFCWVDCQVGRFLHGILMFHWIWKLLIEKISLDLKPVYYRNHFSDSCRFRLVGSGFLRNQSGPQPINSLVWQKWLFLDFCRFLPVGSRCSSKSVWSST